MALEAAEGVPGGVAPRPPQGGGARMGAGWMSGVGWGAGVDHASLRGTVRGFRGDRLHGAGVGVSRAGAGGCPGGLRGAGQVHT